MKLGVMPILNLVPLRLPWLQPHYGNNGEDIFEDVDSMVVNITDNRAEFLEFGFRSPKVDRDNRRSGHLC